MFLKEKDIWNKRSLIGGNGMPLMGCLPKRVVREVQFSDGILEVLHYRHDIIVPSQLPGKRQAS